MELVSLLCRQILDHWTSKNGGSIIFKPLQVRFSVVSVCCIRTNTPPKCSILQQRPFIIFEYLPQALLFWAWPAWSGVAWMPSGPQGGCARMWMDRACLHLVSNPRRPALAYSSVSQGSLAKQERKLPAHKSHHPKQGTQAQIRELERWESSSCWKELLGHSAE